MYHKKQYLYPIVQVLNTVIHKKINILGISWLSQRYFRMDGYQAQANDDTDQNPTH